MASPSLSAPSQVSGSSLRLPTSFAIIFGAFTLGFHVAIQGPTLMDLIDLLHVNNDIMSYSLAFASLAYSLGGLLSGFLFNYVNRQVLICAYYVVFGCANILTPFISNYYIFSVITVFKMMCAGGTDCGANVWMLELWPGKDAWLQALHFSFAVGCALGPLIVEPFLSNSEHKDGDIEAKLHQGGALINDQNNESRIYIPYGVSGSILLLSACLIMWIYLIDEKRKKAAAKLRAKQQAASGEQILLTAVQHPAAIEAGVLNLPETIYEEEIKPLNEEADQDVEAAHGHSHGPTMNASSRATTPSAPSLAQPQQQQHQPETPSSPSLASQSKATSVPNNLSRPQTPDLLVGIVTSKQSQQQSRAIDQISLSLSSDQHQQTQQQQQLQKQPQHSSNVKITSKAKEQLVGRPPYYVMFAIALAALCLSFYCGIEITSMNYLATFAVNIDLQLPKSTAALMSSALTISFAIGRAFGIWIAAYMKPHKLFYLCAGVMATGNVFMLIFANTAETLLWYSICLFGIGCGPMFPAIVSFYDDKISKVTNTVSGIFILGSMFNVALNSLIIGHYIIDNALILIVCNLVGSVLLLLLFATLHMLTKVKKQQRVRKFKLQQQKSTSSMVANLAQVGPPSSAPLLEPASLTGNPKLENHLDQVDAATQQEQQNNESADSSNNKQSSSTPQSSLSSPTLSNDNNNTTSMNINININNTSDNSGSGGGGGSGGANENELQPAQSINNDNQNQSNPTPSPTSSTSQDQEQQQQQQQSSSALRPLTPPASSHQATIAT